MEGEHKQKRRRGWKKIKMFYACAPTSCKSYDHYILQACSNKKLRSRKKNFFKNMIKEHWYIFFIYFIPFLWTPFLTETHFYLLLVITYETHICLWMSKNVLLPLLNHLSLDITFWVVVIHSDLLFLCFAFFCCCFLHFLMLTRTFLSV